MAADGCVMPLRLITQPTGRADRVSFISFYRLESNAARCGQVRIRAWGCLASGNGK